MILEGLITTTLADGRPHLAPMGPSFSQGSTQIRLRPYHTSQTGENLRRDRCGVFHTTENVLLITQAALGVWNQRPEPIQFQPARTIPGWILPEFHQAYEFRIESMDLSQPRHELFAEVLATHRGGEWSGFHRAKHAVLEATIHATRLFLLEPDWVLAEFERCQTIIDKTGTDQEQQAMQLLWVRVKETFPHVLEARRFA